MNLTEMLANIRARGWMVGCHNDYTLSGQKFTYWMFTHEESGKYVHGEAANDEEAVAKAMRLMPNRP